MASEKEHTVIINRESTATLLTTEAQGTCGRVSRPSQTTEPHHRLVTGVPSFQICGFEKLVMCRS